MMTNRISIYDENQKNPKNININFEQLLKDSFFMILNFFFYIYIDDLILRMIIMELLIFGINE